MQIASWNVNSAKARQDHILNYLRAGSCDVLLIQETKTQDVNFPVEAYQELGWHVAFHGQKSYNGVAIAARMPLEDVTSGLPGDDEDEQARYMEATVGGVRVATIYLPNGNPAPGPKFDYKLSWMKRLRARAGEMLASEMPVVLGGDFNVIPQDIDCYDPPGWEGDALTRRENRAAFYSLCHDGYTDALRACHPAEVRTATGIIRPAPGKRTTACGSTTCCCHRRPPTGSPARASTRTARRRKTLRPHTRLGGTRLPHLTAPAPIT